MDIADECACGNAVDSGPEGTLICRGCGQHPDNCDPVTCGDD